MREPLKADSKLHNIIGKSSYAVFASKPSNNATSIGNGLRHAAECLCGLRCGDNVLGREPNNRIGEGFKPLSKTIQFAAKRRNTVFANKPSQHAAFIRNSLSHLSENACCLGCGNNILGVYTCYRIREGFQASTKCGKLGCESTDRRTTGNPGCDTLNDVGSGKSEYHFDKGLHSTHNRLVDESCAFDERL